MASPHPSGSDGEVSDGAKTEEATPRKLERARRRGEVAKSADLAGALALLAALAGLAPAAAAMAASARRALETTLAAAGAARPDWGRLVAPLAELLGASLLVGLAGAAGGLAGHLLQSGPLWATEALKPRLSGLDPGQGLRKLASADKLADLAKNVLRALICAAMVGVTLRAALPDLLRTIGQPETAARLGAGLTRSLLGRTALLLLALGILDLPGARRRFARRQRMSRAEVKREHKDDHGDPQIMGWRRQRAQDLATGALDGLRDADAVVVNPTHVAVALAYTPARHEAPVVVVKGRRRRAARIRARARALGIPVVRNVPLARALHAVAIDEEIPERLFVAVAEVLAFVHRVHAEGSPVGPQGSPAGPNG